VVWQAAEAMADASGVPGNDTSARARHLIGSRPNPAEVEKKNHDDETGLEGMRKQFNVDDPDPSAPSFYGTGKVQTRGRFETPERVMLGRW